MAFCCYSELADNTDTQCVCMTVSELLTDIYDLSAFHTSDEHFLSEKSSNLFSL